MNDSDKYRTMSPEQLAEVQHGLLGKSSEDILIEREWRRRERIEQHELDLKLLFKQGKWMIVSAFIGLFGVILGAFLTYFLTTSIKKEPERLPPTISTLPDQQRASESKEPSQTKRGE